MAPSPDYYTPAQLAARWQITRTTLRKWIAAGLISVVKLSPNIHRVPRASVEAFERRYPRKPA